MKKWMLCIDGTKNLKEGHTYLVQPYKDKVKVLQWKENLNIPFGSMVKAERFIDITDIVDLLEDTDEDTIRPAPKADANQLDLFN